MVICTRRLQEKIKTPSAAQPTLDVSTNPGITHTQRPIDRRSFRHTQTTPHAASRSVPHSKRYSVPKQGTSTRDAPTSSDPGNHTLVVEHHRISHITLGISQKEKAKHIPLTDTLPVAVLTSPCKIDFKSGLPFSNRTHGGRAQSCDPSLSGVLSRSTELISLKGMPPLVAKILIDTVSQVGVRALARKSASEIHWT